VFRSGKWPELIMFIRSSDQLARRAAAILGGGWTPTLPEGSRGRPSAVASITRPDRSKAAIGERSKPPVHEREQAIGERSKRAINERSKQAITNDRCKPSRTTEASC
jgi:hypothetical protein